jgi:hypothetical protein
MTNQDIKAANNRYLFRADYGVHQDISWCKGTSGASRPEVLGVRRQFEPITNLAALRSAALRPAAAAVAHDGSGIVLPGADSGRKVEACDGDAMHAASCALIAATGSTCVLHAAPAEPAPIVLDEIEPTSLATWLASKRDMVIPRG